MSASPESMPKAPKGQEFFFPELQESAGDVEALGKCIKSLRDHELTKYCERNDFSHWVNDILHESDLASSLNGVRNKFQLYEYLDNYLGKFNEPKNTKNSSAQSPAHANDSIKNDEIQHVAPRQADKTLPGNNSNLQDIKEVTKSTPSFDNKEAAVKASPVQAQVAPQVNQPPAPKTIPYPATTVKPSAPPQAISRQSPQKPSFLNTIKNVTSNNNTLSGPMASTSPAQKPAAPIQPVNKPEVPVSTPIIHAKVISPPPRLPPVAPQTPVNRSPVAPQMPAQKAPPFPPQKPMMTSPAPHTPAISPIVPQKLPVSAQNIPQRQAVMNSPAAANAQSHPNVPTANIQTPQLQHPPVPNRAMPITSQNVAPKNNVPKPLPSMPQAVNIAPNPKTPPLPPPPLPAALKPAVSPAHLPAPPVQKPVEVRPSALQPAKANVVAAPPPKTAIPPKPIIAPPTAIPKNDIQTTPVENGHDITDDLESQIESSFEKLAAASEPVGKQVIDEKVWKKIKLELDENEKAVIYDFVGQGFYAFEIDITLDKSCILKSARTIDILKRLEEVAQIAKSVPSLNNVQYKKFGQGVSIVVATDKNEEELRRIVGEVKDIEKIDMISFTKKESSGSEKKDDRAQKAPAQPKNSGEMDVDKLSDDIPPPSEKQGIFSLIGRKLFSRKK